jgi:hypothetical protein
MCVYARFTRAVFTREVAFVTLLLLVAGPSSALGAELHVGSGEHDTLLLGALILWLVTLRLRGRGDLRAQLALDAGVGLVVGVALWCDFLILPFALAATLALTTRAMWRVYASRERAFRIRLGAEAGVAVAFFLVGLAPLLMANIGSGGATFHEVFVTANDPSGQLPPLLPGLAGSAQALYLQIAATLLVGLPHVMGKTVVCGPCAIWPLPTDGISTGVVIWTAVVSLAYTLFAVLCWTLTALPLAHDVLRDLRRDLRRAQAARRRGAGARAPLSAARGTYDARWWGRAMLALGALGTVAQYALSRAPYSHPISSSRYLVGLFLCMPLVAAPLVAGLQAGRRWAATVRPESRPELRQHPHWPPLSAIAASVLLVTLIALNIGGWRGVLAASNDRAAFGQPTGQQHAVLISYLQEQQITRFYTDYWTCYKVVFATDQQVSCAVFNDNSVFDHGRTRINAMSALVAATPHAPYVFDMTSAQQQVRANEFASAIFLDDRRAAGYVRTRVGTFEVYVYTGGA